MFERRIPTRCLGAKIALVASLCLLSSCAHKGDAPAVPNSDAALLDSTEKSSDALDAALFSDLDPNNLKDAAAALSTSVTDEAGVVQNSNGSSGEAFYNPIGGESLARVAYTLYGDKRFAKKLLTKNPELKGIKKLGPEHKVYFDMETARPQATYLTKDLLDRYPAQLAARVLAVSQAKKLGQSSITISQGETLQAISQKLYGTTRYWPEIFLANQDKIQNYDRVAAGLSLSVYEHPAAPRLDIANKESEPAVVAAAPAPVLASPPAAVMPAPPQPAQKTMPLVMPTSTMPTQPKEVNTQITQAATDPLPETPPAPAVAKPVEPPKVDSDSTASNNANFRRILYVVLILAIGGVLLFFTRRKKFGKFDMLDMTTADTAQRPKLTPAPKDSRIG